MPSTAFSQPLRVDGIGSCELGGPLPRWVTRVADDDHRRNARDARGGSGFRWSVAALGGGQAPRGGGPPPPGGRGCVVVAGSTGSSSGVGVGRWEVR
ncbi:hypothetical protein TIFTF001_041696 [Ficus carica]|uniref:Uncharacterized protein n=1 Tax=Ficus carica TaxID=3494 RepID=A0AA87Z9N1_FICCA|nr:hypothetical protein TIFTF001_041696 [Ficus carica]